MPLSETETPWPERKNRSFENGHIWIYLLCSTSWLSEVPFQWEPSPNRMFALSFCFLRISLWHWTLLTGFFYWFLLHGRAFFSRMIQYSVPQNNVMTTVLGLIVPETVQWIKHCNKCWGTQTCLCPCPLRAHGLKEGRLQRNDCKPRNI